MVLGLSLVLKWYFKKRRNERGLFYFDSAVCCGWAVVRPSAWSGHLFKHFTANGVVYARRLGLLLGHSRKWNVIIAQIRLDANFSQLNTCDTEILLFLPGGWGGALHEDTCVRQNWSGWQEKSGRAGGDAYSGKLGAGCWREKIFEFSFCLFCLCVCWIVRKVSWCKYLLSRERAASVGALRLSSTVAFCRRGGTHRPLALCSCFSFYIGKKVSVTAQRRFIVLLSIWLRSPVFYFMLFLVIILFASHWEFLSSGWTWRCRSHNGKSQLFFLFFFLGKTKTRLCWVGSQRSTKVHQFNTESWL